MNALINNILLASFLFIVTFSIASSFVYPTTKAAVVPTKTIPQLLMLTPSILEPITFSVSSIPVPEEITTSDHIQERTTQLIEEPLVQSPISVIEPVEIFLPTQLIENPTVEPTETLPLPTELIAEPTVEPTETIPRTTQLIEEPTVEVNDNLQDLVGVATQGVTIINNLNKRQSLKLFTPLQMKRKVNQVEKNLATTKAEILTLYKENPTQVINVLQTHLPELFTV